jgi:hypothetical protein
LSDTCHYSTDHHKSIYSIVYNIIESKIKKTFKTSKQWMRPLYLARSTHTESDSYNHYILPQEANKSIHEDATECLKIYIKKKKKKKKTQTNKQTNIKLTAGVLDIQAAVRNPIAHNAPC